MPQTTATESLAEVDGEAITAQQLLAREAAKRGTTVAALLDAEVTAKVGLVTEQEIEKFYQDNKAEIQGEQAQVRDQIRADLQNQKLQTRREAFIQSLRSQAKVVVNLKAAPVQRIEVSVQGAPFKGADRERAGAKITVKPGI